MTDQLPSREQRRARDIRAEDKRVYLGQVSVDGGELLVVDPAYLPEKYDVLDEEIHGDLHWYGYGHEVLRSRDLPDLRLAMLLRLESDGGYPVWAEVTNKDRVLRYTIEIALPHEDEGR